MLCSLSKNYLNKTMKHLMLLLVLFCTMSVGYSLKCYLCGSANGNEVECGPTEQTCDTLIFSNGTSCVTINYQIYGNSVTYKGCYFKMKEKEGMLNYGAGVNVAATYTSCDEDLCNGSENVHKKFNIFAITGVLFVLTKLF